MRSYFFSIILCSFIYNQTAFSQTTTAQPASELYYPAVEISSQLSNTLFVDRSHAVINCPILFDGSWQYPNGASMSLCDDAQLACLRYGLLVQKAKIATDKLLEEIKKTIALQKKELELKLRGCQLVLEATLENEPLLDVAGYPNANYGPVAPEPIVE